MNRKHVDKPVYSKLGKNGFKSVICNAIVSFRKQIINYQCHFISKYKFLFSSSEIQVYTYKMFLFSFKKI